MRQYVWSDLGCVGFEGQEVVDEDGEAVVEEDAVDDVLVVVGEGVEMSLLVEALQIFALLQPSAVLIGNRGRGRVG